MVHSVTKIGIARDSQGQIAPELKCIYSSYVWEPVSTNMKVNIDLGGIGFRLAIITKGALLTILLIFILYRSRARLTNIATTGA